MQKFNALDKKNNTLVSGNAGDGKYLHQGNRKKKKKKKKNPKKTKIKKIINLIEFLK